MGISTSSSNRAGWRKFIPRYEPPPLPAMDWRERIALMVGTGLTSGFIKPFAPSWGSIPGFALFIGLSRLPLPVAMLLFAMLLIPAVWSGTVCERLLGSKDPRPVVIDEIAAVPFALWPLWLHWPQRWVSWLILFAIYRIMDYLKPWPANRLQSVPGGLGVLVDDIVSSTYMGLGLAVLLHFRPGII